MNITEKLIKLHLCEGKMSVGEEIAIRIDNTLTQDSTGTMAYLQFEAMGIDRVRTKRSVAYVDHNLLQCGFENADDHLYIKTVAAKHGVWFSRPGNGICHQVQLERFAVPGETLLGSDSHTPTCGAMGMLAMGAGGLDVAVAMGGGAYYLAMPRVCRVLLTGKLPRMVSAKDIILELLRRKGVKGGLGCVFEYAGSGLSSLSVPDRATIANMGAELGATTSVFPSDDATLEFMKAQRRGADWRPLAADEDARYAETIEIDLSALVPLAACPHSPGNVVPVSELASVKITQAAIGSCTNSSLRDMARAASILKGKTVNEEVSLVVSPGSKQVLLEMSRDGLLADFVASGARILECGCGPCIGMGQSPETDGVSVRTFNRNFYARSGTASANVYLVSPETAAASAIAGYICDPRTLKVDFYDVPLAGAPCDNMLIPPAEKTDDITVVRGPNIKPFPVSKPLQEQIAGEILIKLPDDITTDHIMPSNAKLLPYRSNIPFLSDYCLSPCDQEFSKRAKRAGGGIIVAGSNYGQGSSREHAALVPLYLGVKAVIAKSFARIHRSNLINNGILPFEFRSDVDYDRAVSGGSVVIPSAREAVIAAAEGKPVVCILDGQKAALKLEISLRQRDILLAGGLLNYTRENT